MSGKGESQLGRLTTAAFSLKMCAVHNKCVHSRLWVSASNSEVTVSGSIYSSYSLTTTVTEYQFIYVSLIHGCIIFPKIQETPLWQLAPDGCHEASSIPKLHIRPHRTKFSRHGQLTQWDLSTPILVWGLVDDVFSISGRKRFWPSLIQAWRKARQPSTFQSR